MQLIPKDMVVQITDEEMEKIGEYLDEYYKKLYERVGLSNKTIREIFGPYEKGDKNNVL